MEKKRKETNKETNKTKLTKKTKFCFIFSFFILKKLKKGPSINGERSLSYLV